jgi:hypothetical protein
MDKKSHELKLQIWYGSRDKHIHIKIEGVDDMVTVAHEHGRGQGKRWHPKLYRLLRETLVQAGKWPADAPREEQSDSSDE